MSAELLRRAASLMRERATDTAVPQGTWFVEDDDPRWNVLAEDPTSAYPFDVARDVPGDEASPVAMHIASWHPAVALAVAKAIDDVALAWEICDGWTRDLDDDAIPFEDTVDGGWLAVARAYLGASG